MQISQRIPVSELEKPFDLIIIGGGINAAGLARDAAERGLRVLLLEKNDFASGCSAHSTRLVHGGLRYLEHMEFSLVYESLQEREILLRNYPHLVKPIGLMIPTYTYSKLGQIKLNIGMALYDLLSFNKSLPHYRSFTKIDQRFQDLEHKGLRGAVFYYDAQLPFVERLVLENIMTAQERGAICLNHCQVTAIKTRNEAGKLVADSVEFVDMLADHTFQVDNAGRIFNSDANQTATKDISATQSDVAISMSDANQTATQDKNEIQEQYGAAAISNRSRKYRVQGQNIINMAGPWVDLLNDKLQIASSSLMLHSDAQKQKQLVLSDNNGPAKNLELIKSQKEIGGTKGSHIVVKNFLGAPKDHGIYIEARADARPFFILPWKIAANQTHYLIGTTDIPVNDKNLDKLEVSQKEIDYLLKEVNALFPQALVNQRDIVKTFVGVRPLPKTGSASDPGAVTRKHFIKDYKKQGLYNYYSIIGGKITTFRNLAREIADKFSFAPCRTDKTPTLNALFPTAFDAYLANKSYEYSIEYDVSKETAEHLIKLYGSSANRVLDLVSQDPLLGKSILEGYADIRAQIVYAIRHESACTVEDILRRRLSIGLLRDKLPDSVTELCREFLVNVNS